MAIKAIIVSETAPLALRVVGPARRARAWKRTWLVVLQMFAAAFLVAALASPGWAQPYPNRPIRLILPFPPGGSTDILGRIVAQTLGERLGQTLVADNRPGLGGYLGLELASRAAPDGHTIVIGSLIYASGPSTYRTMKFNPQKDLAPISQISEAPNFVVVNLAVAAKTLKDLVDHVRANPRKLHYATSGTGSTLHLSAAMLSSVTKMDMVHVPYKGGGGPAMTAVLGGEVQVIVLGPASVPHFQTGKARALAVLGEKRAPVAPEVPTAREQGFDVVVTGWHGLLAPAGTPRAFVERLNKEWVQVANGPDIRERLQKLGFDPRPGTPEQFTAFLKAETERWTRLIKEANIPAAD
ncbi:MAG: tripartite tricarboxylate transporter substrate binding protein [Betaproteobacteria bacterium]|nr:tripartite tricarboxylate transporter substrate binding protein [Betaproteobacteria bacterium]